MKAKTTIQAGASSGMASGERTYEPVRCLK
jgi:hypothetical protein